MKLLNSVVVVLAMGAIAGTAQAQDDNDFYVNLGVDSYDFDAYGIGGKVGKTFQDYFGVEIQGTLGVTEDEFEVFGDTIEAKTDFGVGAFGVIRSPVGERFWVFARGGYHYIEGSAKLNGVSLPAVSDEGFAGGGGAEYMIDEQNGIRLEYTYFDFSDTDSSGDLFSLSYVRKF